MQTLPASVRVALWATAALARRVDLDEVTTAALPDIDHCEGLAERLTLWRDLGEQVVLAGLPRPGTLDGMPRGSADLVAAATRAEELIYVPSLGGAAVPDFDQFGPEGDQGWAVRWQAFDADPVPVHTLEAVALPDVELQLRQQVASLTSTLATAGGPPLDPSGLYRRARATLQADWGLPDGVPPRAMRVVELAGRLTALADTGLDSSLASVAATDTVRREQVLRDLHRSATSALVAATTVACLHLSRSR